MNRQANVGLPTIFYSLCILLNGTGIIAELFHFELARSPVTAASPQPSVHFDAPSSAACLDVTPLEFQAQNPLEKLMAVRVAVSLLSNARDASEIDEVVYYLHAFENRGQIIDYGPKTTAVSDVVGSIRVSTESKTGGGLQLNAGAHFEEVLDGGASFTNSNSQSALETFERLPSRDVVVASGTIGRGSGVYFKLRNHSQLALEGEHHVMLVMQVPLQWRADYLRLICRAYGGNGKHGNLLLADESLLLPIYAEGDLVARNLATHLLNAQRALLRSTEQYQRAIEKRRRPTLAHELSLTDPEIPNDWLSTVLWSNSANEPSDFERRLPPAVQEAVQEYRAARLAVIGWRGSQDSPVPATSAASDQIASDATEVHGKPNRVVALKVALPAPASTEDAHPPAQQLIVPHK